MTLRVAAHAILLSTVVFWTAQPAPTRAIAFVDAANAESSALEQEVDADKFDSKCVSDWGVRISVLTYSSVRPADDSPSNLAFCDSASRHLRGPPAA